MALITALRVGYRGSKRRSIFLDGQEWRTTSNLVVRMLGLTEGDEVDESSLKTDIDAAETPAARERALRLLGYREHGSVELHGKLLDDGYPPEIATSVVSALTRVGLVDDDRYAAVLARTLIDGRRYGRGRARREMLRRGLTDEKVDAALDSCCPESGEYERVLELARKYARPDLDTRRLAARLARRGYPVGMCFDAARHALETTDEWSSDDLS